MLDQSTLLYKSLKIRLFEEKLLSLISEKKLAGTVHTCIGQEVIPITLMKYLSSQDYVFSNHRCHGHYLALFDDYSGLAQELMAQESGVCFGLGGSQHINRANFYSSGIQGGMLGVSAGIALSFKEKKIKGISVSFIGDGTFGEGSVYEVFNIVSKWQLPMLIVVEDNKYAQSTSQTEVLAGTIENRCLAFNLSYLKCSSNDLSGLDLACKKAVEITRESGKPCVLHIETYRISPHSKGDDFRDQKEIQNYKNVDVVEVFSKTLDKKKYTQLQDEIDLAFVIVPEMKKYVPIVDEVKEQIFNINSMSSNVSTGVRKDINQALLNLFETNGDLIIIGEDLKDPYGGAFKVTKGLSDEYPGRVFNTPISESAIVGIGIGRALFGLPTIVEIMFSDFLALANDQILNTGTKLTAMFGKKKNLPLVIRCANGPNNGYGATHSQDMSGYYQSMAFLDVYMPSKYTQFDKFYSALFGQREKMALVFENKKLYSTMSNLVKKELLDHYELVSYGAEPSVVYHLRPIKQIKDFTIITTALCLDEIEESLAALINEEIFCDVFIPHDLKSLNWADVEVSLKQTKRLLIVEGSLKRSGWATNIWYNLSKKLNFKGEIISSSPAVIPASVEKEREIFPNTALVLQKIRGIYESH